MLTWDALLQEVYKGEKIDLECKLAGKAVPQSVYETYCSFANTRGGNIILGVEEDKSKSDPQERFIIRGVADPERLREDFWNTLNSQKVNTNILVDGDVYVVKNENIALLVIHVPRADYTMRPVYRGENPFKGTYKRNHEGDYHAKDYEVRAMIRDQSSEGNDSTILEGFTMDDIDHDALQRYRIMFNTSHPDHVWRELPDQQFLEMLGGYRRDRRDKTEGLTVAGLMVFGTGLAIRDEFDNILMDYRDETGADVNHRWIDRVTYDGTWENNLFNFFMKVTPKLTGDLKKPFVLDNMRRIDDTPVHEAIREAFVNMIIHADYRMDAGVLKIIKTESGFIFTNPGSLKLPKEQIYRGGNSKARNPHIQTMLRLIGFGDNAGSGFPKILKTWADNGWPQPSLEEDTLMNQVSLLLLFSADSLENPADGDKESVDRSGKSVNATEKVVDISVESAGIAGKAADKPVESAGIAEKAVDKSEESVDTVKGVADKTKDSADKPQKVTEKDDCSTIYALSTRQKDVLRWMERGKSYSRQEISDALGIRRSRTGQLLNELVSMGMVIATGATRYRRYMKK